MSSTYLIKGKKQDGKLRDFLTQNVYLPSPVAVRFLVKNLFFRFVSFYSPTVPVFTSPARL